MTARRMVMPLLLMIMMSSSSVTFFMATSLPVFSEILMVLTPLPLRLVTRYWSMVERLPMPFSERTRTVGRVRSSDSVRSSAESVVSSRVVSSRVVSSRVVSSRVVSSDVVSSMMVSFAVSSTSIVSSLHLPGLLMAIMPMTWSSPSSSSFMALTPVAPRPIVRTLLSLKRRARPLRLAMSISSCPLVRSTSATSSPSLSEMAMMPFWRGRE